MTDERLKHLVNCLLEGKNNGEDDLDRLLLGRCVYVGDTYADVTQVLEALGLNDEKYRYREVGASSPSCSAASWRFYDLPSGGVLQIGVPYDSSWFEATILRGDEAVKNRKLQGVKTYDRCFEDDYANEIKKVRSEVL